MSYSIYQIAIGLPKISEKLSMNKLVILFHIFSVDFMLYSLSKDGVLRSNCLETIIYCLILIINFREKL